MKIKSLVVAALVTVLGACAQESSAPDQSADTAPATGEAARAPAAADSEPAASTDIDSRLANADAEAGKRFYIFCQACHTVKAGGMNKVGPNLHGIMNRPAAKADGFTYSAPLNESGLSWDVATLDRWIAAPNDLVPGTTMVFAGIADAGQRADLIAFLQQATAAE